MVFRATGRVSRSDVREREAIAAPHRTGVPVGRYGTGRRGDLLRRFHVIVVGRVKLALWSQRVRRRWGDLAVGQSFGEA